MRRAAMFLPALAVASALVVPVAADASFKLRPGQERTYHCVKNHGRPACIDRIRSLEDGRWLRHSVGGRTGSFWWHPWTLGESLNVESNCRRPTCSVWNNGPFPVRVWRR